MKKFITVLIIISILTFTAFADGESIFEKQNSYNNEFHDISENDWFFNNVVASYEYGMLKGKGINTFAPNDNISYAEVIALACRLHTKYKDINYDFSGENLWYEPYILYAKNYGIIATNFELSRAKLPATRADAINILLERIPSENFKNENPYIKRVYDMLETQKGYSAVLKAIKSGIINGKDANGSVYPDMPVTRAEIAAILERIMFPEKRISQVREFYEKKDDKSDSTEFYIENKYIPNYGYVNNTWNLCSYYYLDGYSMYVYEYNEKETEKFEAMLGEPYGATTSTELWDDKTYLIEKHKIRILKTKKYNMVMIEFNWDEEYYNNFKSEMQNTESDTSIKAEDYDLTERYLESEVVPNFGKMNNLKSLERVNYFDEVAKVKYVYDFYPIDSINYCIELLDMGYEQGKADGNKLFWKADFKNRSQTITVFMNFMENTLEISFEKK